MPPLPTALIEEGEEFWGRYPAEMQQGFSADVEYSAMHAAKLSQDFFPIVAQVPKRFTGRNRRHLDVNIARFESEKHKEVDRTGWGLPEPNREAAYVSLAKYAKCVEVLSLTQVRALNKAASWLDREFSPYMCNSRVKEQDEVVAGLEKSTSCGFPWVRKYKTKRDMIDNWKDFPQYMSEDWDRLKEENYTAVFGNSLKEEIRLAEKIAENSIRTFTAGPIEMTIHGNRLFEDMNQKFYDSHLKTASAVGMCPLKGGWNNLYRKLKKFRNGFALDESQYDSSLRSFLMWACAEFRWNMLRAEDQTPDNLLRLKVYYRNLVNTLIITSDGVLVMKKGGNPSGSVNTIVDNTMILYMLMAYGWIMVCPTSKNTYEAFSENLALALVGDDNTWTVSDEALGFYNARSLIAEWKKLGITTTTDCLDPRPVEELDFLSAHTVFVDGIAVPLYDRNKLLTSLLYSLQPDNPAYTLTRVAGISQMAWTDETFRVYNRELVGWLVEQYSDVLHDNAEWKLALRQVMSDQELRKLMVGEEIPLSNQSYSECRERLRSGIKSSHTKYSLTGPTYHSGLIEKIKIADKRFCDMLALPQRQRKPRQRNLSRTVGAVLPNKSGVGFHIAAPTEVVKRVNVGLPFPGKAQAKKQRMTNKQPKPRSNGYGSWKDQGMNEPRRGGPGVSFGPGGPIRSRSMDMRVTAGGQTLQSSRRQVIEQDEYIAVVNGTNSATPTVTPYSINPGQVLTFPWLSKVALLFEKYTFEALEFYFKTRTSQFQTQGQGAIVLSCDYDAADAPPTTLQQTLDMDPHVDDVPYEQLRLFLQPFELNDGGRRKGKYVRPGALPGGGDIKTYDAGNLFVTTVNNGSTAELGELRVRYRVRLEVPVLESTASAPANNQVAVFNSAAPEAIVTTVQKQLVLATATFNGLAAVNTGGSILVPAGNYLLDVSALIVDTTATTTSASISVVQGVTQIGTSAFTDTTTVGDVTLTAPPMFFQSTGVALSALTVLVTVTGGGTLTATGAVRIVAV